MPDQKTDNGQQAGGSGQQVKGDQSQPGGETLTWDAWLAQQPDAVKTLFDEHVKGLKTALDTERAQRSDLAKQLREATQKLEKDSDARKGLEELASKLEIAERRAMFYEEASKPDVQCTNPRLAWLVAQEANLFDRRGMPDWGAIRAAAPELFRRVGVGSADGGTGQTGQQQFDMNAAIRRAAGRQ
jgi:polyhydroxyalkanoate synthesis regulator phasin